MFGCSSSPVGYYSHFQLFNYTNLSKFSYKQFTASPIHLSKVKECLKYFPMSIPKTKYKFKILYLIPGV